MKRKLEFSYENRHYKLSFRDFNVMLIIGDSSVGKSLLCSDLKRVKNFDDNYSDVCVLNVFDDDYLQLLSSEDTYNKYSMFVIDNADILVTPEVSEIIKKHYKHSWILMGHEIPSCVLSATCICKLEYKDGVFSNNFSWLK